MRFKDNSVTGLEEGRQEIEYENPRDERTEMYFRSLSDPLEGCPFLQQLEQDCLKQYIPVIRKPMQRFLAFEMKSRRPGQILEIGTALGFSSILMALAAPADCRITTVENSEERVTAAGDNIRRAGFEERIQVLQGDAGQILTDLAEQGKTFDFIFMDAAKGQYPLWLPVLKKLMTAKTLLVTDNVLQEGDLIESHYMVPRRNRTIHKRVREYLYLLTHDPELSTDILDVGDGIALTARTGMLGDLS